MRPHVRWFGCLALACAGSGVSVLLYYWWAPEELHPNLSPWNWLVCTVGFVSMVGLFCLAALDGEFVPVEAGADKGWPRHSFGALPVVLVLCLVLFLAACHIEAGPGGGLPRVTEVALWPVAAALAVAFVALCAVGCFVIETDLESYAGVSASARWTRFLVLNGLTLGVFVAAIYADSVINPVVGRKTSGEFFTVLLFLPLALTATAGVVAAHLLSPGSRLSLRADCEVGTLYLGPLALTAIGWLILYVAAVGGARQGTPAGPHSWWVNLVIAGGLHVLGVGLVAWGNFGDGNSILTSSGPSVRLQAYIERKDKEEAEKRKFDLQEAADIRDQERAKREEADRARREEAARMRKADQRRLQEQRAAVEADGRKRQEARDAVRLHFASISNSLGAAFTSTDVAAAIGLMGDELPAMTVEAIGRKAIDRMDREVARQEVLRLYESWHWVIGDVFPRQLLEDTIRDSMSDDRPLRDVLEFAGNLKSRFARLHKELYPEKKGQKEGAILAAELEKQRREHARRFHHLEAAMQVEIDAVMASGKERTIKEETVALIRERFEEQIRQLKDENP